LSASGEAPNVKESI